MVEKEKECSKVREFLNAKEKWIQFSFLLRGVYTL